MTIKTKFLIINFCLFFSGFAWSQEPMDKASILALFDHPAHEIELREYVGKFDQVHNVKMVLAHSPDEYRGYYTFDGGQNFLLEGKLIDGRVKLFEIDQQDQVTAELELVIGDNDTLTGNWRNKSGSRHFAINFFPAKGNLDSPDCDNWHRTYDGLLEDKPFSITLMKEDVISNKISFSLSGSHFSFETTCEKEDCTVMTADLSHLGSKYESLTIFLKQDDKLLVKAIKKNRHVIQSNIYLAQELSFECQYQVKYTGIYALLYPTLNKNFDQWFRDKMSSFFSAIAESNKKESPNNRLIDYYLSWVDVHYYDGDWISGLFVYQMNSESKPQTIPFNYNIRKDRPIDSDDIFDNDFNYKTMLKPDIAKESERFPNEIRQLYKSQTFDKLTFSSQGVCLNSEFNSLLGINTFTFPYDERYDDLSKSFRKKFVKK